MEEWLYVDTADVQANLFDNIAEQYDRRQRLCLVEMCTNHKPFIEDLGILGKADADGPPSDLISSTDISKFVPRFVSSIQYPVSQYPVSSIEYRHFKIPVSSIQYTRSCLALQRDKTA